MEETTKKSIYQKILDSGKEAFKSLNQAIEKNRDKRAFESAYDNALEKRDKAVQERMELYNGIGKYGDNIEKIIKTRVEERQSELTMEFIKDEYMNVFDEDLPIRK